MLAYAKIAVKKWCWDACDYGVYMYDVKWGFVIFMLQTFDLTILCLDLYLKVKYVFKVYILPMLALFVGNKNLPL